MWDEFKFAMKFGRGLCCVYEGDDDGGGGGDPPPVALVDHEGSFRENWKDSLPEEIRGEECLNNVAGFTDLVTQHVHGQKSVGKDKIALPGANATDAEWDAFYDAAGRPKTEDDYKVDPDPDIPEGFHSPERMARGRAIARKFGLSKKQWDGLIAWDNSETKMSLAVLDKDAAAELKTAEDTLKEKLGMAYEESLHNVNVLINTTTEEGDNRAEFIKEFGRNPKFVLWANDVAKKMISHEALIAEVTQATPKEAMVKIGELEATPGYSDGTLHRDNPAAEERITKELSELYKQAYPEKQAG